MGIKKLFLFFLILCSALAYAKEVPPKPDPVKFVMDETNTLTSAQIETLHRKLQNYDDSTSNQVVILIIKSLEGEVVDDYAYNVASTWGIGQGYKNNGLLILVAMEERKLDIQVGTGLQGRIGDIGGAKKIVKSILEPNFKAGQYYEGLDKATDEIILMAAGEYKNDGKKKEKEKVPTPLLVVLGVIALIIYSAWKGRRGNRRGGWGGYTGGGYYGGSGWGGGWGGFGGGGGGGFGGGSSFGGGGFDGGGASGSW